MSIAPPLLSPAKGAEHRQAVLAELRRRTGAIGATRAQALAPAAVAATGLAALDQLLGGGLPRGRITEVVGPRSAGRTSLGLSAIAAATRRGEVAALIDVEGALDARSAEAAGIDLARLLWVRIGARAAGPGARPTRGSTGRIEEPLGLGLRAADLLLRGAGPGETSGFGLVVIDVGEAGGASRCAPDAAWLRIARAAECAGVALLVLAARRHASAFAALTVEAQRPRPVLAGLPGQGLARAACSPRVLTAVTSCIQVVRSKLAAPGATVELRWSRGPAAPPPREPLPDVEGAGRAAKAGTLEPPMPDRRRPGHAAVLALRQADRR